MMLKDAGYTPERFPGIKIEGLQTMVEKLPEGDNADHSAWLDKDGNHISAGNFDQDVYYWADVEGPKDLPYLNQHVFNGKYSYFGKLVTQKLTKIINIPVFKNTGNGVSMATKNLGYGAICNTNRLHTPLFLMYALKCWRFSAGATSWFSTSSMACAAIRRRPHAGRPVRIRLQLPFFATDPFAADSVGHKLMVQKRKEMGIKVNEHPRFTEYLRYAERLGLGVVDPAKVQVRHV